MPPLVAITRQVPGTPNIPGATVKMAPANPQMSRAELLAFIKGASACITMFHDRVDEEFLLAAGPQLKAVCNFAVGYDNIDLAACGRRGVIVTNTPDAVTEGTANMAWALILACTRRLIVADRFVRAGRFEKEGNVFPTGWMGMHLAGQTLLIIGPGRIGGAVAKRGVAFGMRIAYMARSAHADWERPPFNARRMSLEEGLKAADVVSIHTPLTAETRHLINGGNIGLLKPTAVLVNTARGPIVDETALIGALQGKRIWGAGLDVFEHEPRVHADLLGLEDVVLAPHIGSGEKYWREEMTAIACRNAAAVVAGKTPPNPVG